MKNCITSKQWDELSQVEKLQTPHDWSNNNFSPNIGQMIEFLGDDFVSIISQSDKGTLRYYISTKNSEVFNSFTRDEIVDALWEAVKFKINNLCKKKL
jgi:hypothetical protein